MRDHQFYQDLLPFFVSGKLDANERTVIEQHLATCAICQADLRLWQAVAAQGAHRERGPTAPPHLVEGALARIHAQPPLQRALIRAFNLLRAQARLVHRELWPVCAAVMAMGLIVSLVAGQVKVLPFLAPLISAASLAAIYGPEHDPASELSLATPTSPWKILLARLTLVSSFNLLLALLASGILAAALPVEVLGALILSWLAPLAFLSALSLLLALWLGTSNAINLVYSLWIVRYLLTASALAHWRASPGWVAALDAYGRFWQNPALLAGLAAVALIAALASVGSARSLNRAIL